MRIDRPLRRSLPCGTASKRSLPWLPKNYSPALDTSQNPYYCGGNNPHVGVVSTRGHCLALHRCAQPVQLPPTTGKASTPVGAMALGEANRNLRSEAKD